MQSKGIWTILCWCGYFSILSKGAEEVSILPRWYQQTSAFIGAIWISLFLQAGVLVWYFCGSCGALMIKTKQNKLQISLPQGQPRAQFPAISPYIHQKRCQLWEPVRFPFPPGRWEPGSGVPLWHLEVFPFLALCLAPDMKVYPENFKTRWFGP